MSRRLCVVCEMLAQMIEAHAGDGEEPDSYQRGYGDGMRRAAALMREAVDNR